MQNFIDLLKKVKQTSDKIKEKEESLRRIQNRFNVALSEILDICRIPCLKAVHAYNETTQLKIGTNKEDFDVSINVCEDRAEINLHVKLFYNNGKQPDEDFQNEDVLVISETLRPYIEHELLQAKLPLQFTGLAIPSSYYLK